MLIGLSIIATILSNRLVVLNEGEVIAEGNPNEAMREQRVVDVCLGS